MNRPVAAIALLVILVLSYSCAKDLDRAAANSNGPISRSNIAPADGPTRGTPDGTQPVHAAAEAPQSFSIVKNAGWFRLEESKLGPKQPRTKVENHDIYFTRYSPKLEMKISLRCDGTVPTGKCRHYWLGWDYYAEELYVYDHNRKVFKVMAAMHRTDQLDSLATHLLTFRDNDGDGIFETLSSGDD